MEQTKELPPVTVYPWSDLAIPQTEIQQALTYLAYKTGKPVTFKQYEDDEGYCEHSISIRVAVADGIRKTSMIDRIRIGDRIFILASNQVTVDLGLAIPIDKHILDDDFAILAYVDHNRIVIPIELTATDSPDTRALFARIIEHSMSMLDFKMSVELFESRKSLAKKFCEAFAQGIKARFTDKEEDFRELERDAQNAYYKIIDFEQKRPVLEKELKYLKRIQQIRKPRLFRVQANALVELLASGQYASINVETDGSTIAVTSPVTIKYDNHSFPLGRYEIKIKTKGDIIIEALDTHPNAEYPHPHVGLGGVPCLGNISADLPKMLGSMRIAEALQVLYEFLSNYNLGNSYEKISHFDPTGEYQDEDDNPCEDCDDSCTSYCIQECHENDGQYNCSDCCDYRTEYCYLDCEYNQNFSQFHPCDNCSDEGTNHCYLDCRYNQKWELQKPCENDCEFEQCGNDCPYFERQQSLKEVNNNETTKST